LKKPDNEESTPAKLPGRYHLLTGDVTSEQTWHAALQASQENFSSIPDTIVNCAGFVYLGQAPHSVPLEDFDRLWQINVKPLYLGVKHIVPHWVSNHTSGHFITIGSISSQRPRPSTVWYGASKGALDTVYYTICTKHLLQSDNTNRQPKGLQPRMQRMVFALTLFAHLLATLLCKRLWSFH
jgi:NAD(P)-dependent dehydrogenase (short-subunit alcohol dehydrogenase family)